MKNFLILVVLVCCSWHQTEEWQTIFDGNSDGWDIKIRYHELEKIIILLKPKMVKLMSLMKITMSLRTSFTFLHKRKI